MSALPHVPLFMDGTWLFMVSIKTAVDLQLLPTRCAMIQLAMNRLRRVSVVLTWHFFRRYAVQFFKYHSVVETTCLLRVICILTKGCSFASWKILT